MRTQKTMLMMGLLALAGIAAIFLPAYAGDLEPSGAPAPTMKTLDEVEPRIAIHASDMPLTITEPNSYYLAEDVNFTDDANNAITIGCDDVTIDLMGYTLKGPDSGSTRGIYMYGRNNVEIRNGTIRDFGSLAVYEGGSNGNNHRLIDMRFLSNGSGVYLNGGGHLVKDCTAADNTSSYGMAVGYGSTVTGNTCHDNVVYGIFADSSGRVSGNICYNNGQYGIYTNSGCTITGNTAMNNTDTGIYASEYCLVDQNTAYGNGTNMSTETGCVLGTNCAP